VRAAARNSSRSAHAGAIDLVEVEQFLDLRQRETEPIAAQIQLSRVRSCAL